MRRTALAGPGEVAEEDARGEIADAYEALRTVLGVSYIPTIYRMLATHGSFLPRAVELLAPALHRSRQMGIPGEMRRTARLVLPATQPVMPASAPRSDVRAVLERYNRANPLNLVFTLLLVGETRMGAATVMAPPLPDPSTDVEVTSALDDIQACHGGFTVPGVWRELFRQPAVAHAAWASIRDTASSGVVATARDRVLAVGRRVVAGNSAGTKLLESQPPDVRATLAWYPALISTMVVEIEQLKRLLP